jgi:TonB family protein
MDYLLAVTLRSLGVGALAGVAIGLLRLKSAAARHAVLSFATAGMLLIGLAAPLMPVLRLRVLRAEQPVAVSIPAKSFASVPPREEADPALRPTLPAAPAPSSRPWPIAWREIEAAVYGAGLLVSLAMLCSSYRFTGRLLRASRQVESGVYESSWLTVPATVGLLQPKILLPADWREWPAGKLEAVMTHERAHVRRGDWAITVMAGINRSLFWFHPLSWWLERRLAALAEEACDDASLLELGKRSEYAQTLLDMAAAVKTGHGRMIWEAMAMAKTAEVRTRIERILDDTRQIPRALNRSRWIALAACGAPLLYLAAAIQLAPAQEVRLSPQAVSQLEQKLAANPDDLAAREQLISHYYLAGVVQPRLEQVYWLIEHHPESGQAATQSAGILNRNTPLNSTSDYDHAAQLWRRQAATHAGEAIVLGHAAQFFSQPGGDPFEAERLLMQAQALDPQNMQWTEKLGLLYASAITAGEGYPKPDAQNSNSAFAQHARSMLVTSQDQQLRSVASGALSPARFAPDVARETALAQHPQLVQLAALSDQLRSTKPTFSSTSTYDVGSGRYVSPALPPPAAETVPQALTVSASVQESKLAQKVAAVYPDAARAAGIEGDVRLDVVIGADGHVKRARLAEGNPLLGAAAQEAVMKYVYQPTLKFGSPVEVATRVTVGFRLNGSDPASGGRWYQGVPVSSGITQTTRAAGPIASANTSPVLTYKKEPSYSPEALAARYQGTVVLAFTVGVNGTPHDIVVLRSLGLGLDEQAIRALQEWKFRPAYQAGLAVEAPSVAEMTFRLAPAANASAAEVGSNWTVAPTGGQTTANQNSSTTAPKIISKTAPEYSDEARRAKYQGTVVLYAVVGVDGKLSNLKVLRSLGLGLDEKALECVSQWTFEPGTRDGRPVEVATQLEVNFRLQ